MKTRAIKTRFMNGNTDLECVVLDLMVNKYGREEIYIDCDIDFDEAIYSDGFVNAINNGLTPILDSIKPSYLPKSNKEYHHLIINDECFVMYFE